MDIQMIFLAVIKFSVTLFVMLIIGLFIYHRRTARSKSKNNKLKQELRVNDDPSLATSVIPPAKKHINRLFRRAKSSPKVDPEGDGTNLKPKSVKTQPAKVKPKSGKGRKISGNDGGVITPPTEVSRDSTVSSESTEIGNSEWGDDFGASQTKSEKQNHTSLLNHRKDNHVKSVQKVRDDFVSNVEERSVARPSASELQSLATTEHDKRSSTKTSSNKNYISSTNKSKVCSESAVSQYSNLSVPPRSQECVVDSEMKVKELSQRQICDAVSAENNGTSEAGKDDRIGVQNKQQRSEESIFDTSDRKDYSLSVSETIDKGSQLAQLSNVASSNQLTPVATAASGNQHSQAAAVASSGNRQVQVAVASNCKHEAPVGLASASASTGIDNNVMGAVNVTTAQLVNTAGVQGGKPNKKARKKNNLLKLGNDEVVLTGSSGTNSSNATTTKDVTVDADVRSVVFALHDTIGDCDVVTDEQRRLSVTRAQLDSESADCFHDCWPTNPIEVHIESSSEVVSSDTNSAGELKEEVSTNRSVKQGVSADRPAKEGVSVERPLKGVSKGERTKVVDSGSSDQLSAVYLQLERERRRAEELDRMLTTSRSEYDRQLETSQSQINNLMCEIELFKSRYSALTADHGLAAELRSARAELSVARAELAERNACVERLGAENTRLRDIAESISSSESSKLSELQRTVAALTEALRLSATQNSTHESTIHRLGSDLKTQELSVHHLTAELQQTRSAMTMELDLVKAAAKVELDRFKSAEQLRLEEMKRVLRQEADKQYAAQAKITKLTSQLAQAQSAQQRLVDNCASQSREIDELRSHLSSSSQQELHSLSSFRTSSAVQSESDSQESNSLGVIRPESAELWLNQPNACAVTSNKPNIETTSLLSNAHDMAGLELPVALDECNSQEQKEEEKELGDRECKVQGMAGNNCDDSRGESAGCRREGVCCLREDAGVEEVHPSRLGEGLDVEKVLEDINSCDDDEGEKSVLTDQVNVVSRIRAVSKGVEDQELGEDELQTIIYAIELNGIEGITHRASPTPPPTPPPSPLPPTDSTALHNEEESMDEVPKYTESLSISSNKVLSPGVTLPVLANPVSTFCATPLVLTNQERVTFVNIPVTQSVKHEIRTKPVYIVDTTTMCNTDDITRSNINNAMFCSDISFIADMTDCTALTVTEDQGMDCSSRTEAEEAIVQNCVVTTETLSNGLAS